MLVNCGTAAEVARLIIKSKFSAWGVGFLTMDSLHLGEPNLTSHGFDVKNFRSKNFL